MSGLDLFGVKLAEASKKLGKKFACGASVVKAQAEGKEEIDVQARAGSGEGTRVRPRDLTRDGIVSSQGDFLEEIADFVVKTWGAEAGIGEEAIKLVDREKK